MTTYQFKKKQPWVHLALWLLFLTILPFYSFESGQPQPADWVMALLIVSVLATGRIYVPRNIKGAFGYALAFVCYTIVVNGLWLFTTSDISFLRASLFYLYNVIAMLVVLDLRARCGRLFWQATLLGLLVASSLQIIMAILDQNAGVRFTGTFNNPNQLGYFSILAASIIYMCVERLSPKQGFKQFFYVGLALYLAVLSLSRAAIVAAVFVIFILLVTQLREKRAIVLAIGFALVISWPAIQTSPVIQSIETRFVSKSHDTFEGRGYERIVRYPSMIIFGAGEGALGRFYEGRAIELHSTPGTVLFSYGIPGSLLFLGLLASTLRKGKLRFSSLLIPIMFYSFSHHGLRFTLFWIFLALTISNSEANCIADGTLSPDKQMGAGV